MDTPNTSTVLNGLVQIKYLGDLRGDFQHHGATGNHGVRPAVAD
jgi:hypothetical protein